MSNPVEGADWPFGKLGEAIEALARRSRLSPRAGSSPNPPADLSPLDADARGHWIDAAIERLGLECEAVDTTHADVERFLCAAGPALVYLPGESEPRFVAVLRARGRDIELLAPDLRVRRVRAAPLAALIRAEIEASRRAGERPSAPRSCASAWAGASWAAAGCCGSAPAPARGSSCASRGCIASCWRSWPRTPLTWLSSCSRGACSAGVCSAAGSTAAGWRRGRCSC
jgi:hypothetical protein